MTGEDPAQDANQLLGGRYRLGELLGVGGSASVFAADDHSADNAVTGAATGPGTARRFAVKILHPELCADDQTRAAFLREAEQAGRIDHPNVVRVHGAGLHDAAGVVMPWIALDLLAGPTLKEWVDSAGRLAVADAAAMLDGVLAGLAAAHAAGIVHRDLTPQNIVLEGLEGLEGLEDPQRGGRIAARHVRIVDFGLADATGHTTLGDDVLLTRRESQANIVGNPQFMSPEQAQGLPVRSVSDLYQAGAVLYYALTGAAPFPRATSAETLRAHVVAPPPAPSALAQNARALDRVVTRAMAKTPALRYRDATDFREAVRAAIELPPVPLSMLDASLDASLDRALDSSLGPGLDHDSARTSVLQPEAGPAAGNLNYLAPPDHARGGHGPTVAPVAAAGGGLLVLGVVAAVIVGSVLAATAGTVPGNTPPPTPVVAVSSAPTSSAAVTPTPSAAPAPTPTPTPTPGKSSPAERPSVQPVTVKAPTLYGTLEQSETALRSAGLTLGTITRIESGEAADRVLAQRPTAGQPVPAGGAVDVTVASGLNVVPSTNGMTVTAATALLESFGFVAAPDLLHAGPTRTVSSSEPAGGAVLRVGVAVILRLAPSEPDTTATPEPPDGKTIR